MAYTPAIADAICERIAAGESISAISRDEKMPSQSAVYEWLEAHPEFAEKYVRARERQADLYAAQIVEISDTFRCGEKTERKEIGRCCSVCGKDVRWLGTDWKHLGGLTPLCAGAKAEKIIEEKIVTGDTVDRSRLQVDARKWAASKLAPKKYGDALKLDGSLSIDVGALVLTARRRLDESNGSASA
jgi:hypothetical protein